MIERGLAARLFIRAAQMLNCSATRCNRVVGGLYTVIIASLQIIMWYVYCFTVAGLVHATFSPVVAWGHTVVALYFLVSVAVNFVLCHTTRPSKPPGRLAKSTQNKQQQVQLQAGGGTAATEASMDEELGLDIEAGGGGGGAGLALTRSQTWRVCEECDAPKPPRTHHCSMCGVCYVRMCHHCPALGKCVARDNYPFFFRFVTSAALGCAFGAATCRVLLARRELGLLTVGGHAAGSGGNGVEKVDESGGGGGGTFDDDGGSKNGAAGGTTQGEVLWGGEGMDEMLFAVMVAGCALAFATGLLAVWHLVLTLSAQTTVEWLENWRVRRRGTAPRRWGWFGGPFTKGVRENVADALGVPTCGRWMPWWSVFFLPFRRGCEVDAVGVTACHQ